MGGRAEWSKAPFSHNFCSACVTVRRRRKGVLDSLRVEKRYAHKRTDESENFPPDERHNIIELPRSKESKNDGISNKQAIRPLI